VNEFGSINLNFLFGELLEKLFDASKKLNKISITTTKPYSQNFGVDY
jgi:hypothetical protein